MTDILKSTTNTYGTRRKKNDYNKICDKYTMDNYPCHWCKHYLTVEESHRCKSKHNIFSLNLQCI